MYQKILTSLQEESITIRSNFAQQNGRTVSQFLIDCAGRSRDFNPCAPKAPRPTAVKPKADPILQIAAGDSDMRFKILMSPYNSLVCY